MRISEKLAELGLELPPAPAAVASYVPWQRSGDLVYVSGQPPLSDGQVACTGAVGDRVGLEEAREAARLSALGVIAQLASAVDDDLEAVEQVVKLTVFVASAPTFSEQHLVANGASDLLADVFGEAGRHARAAVGTPVLPLDMTVEVEAIARIRV